MLTSHLSVNSWQQSTTGRIQVRSATLTAILSPANTTDGRLNSRHLRGLLFRVP